MINNVHWSYCQVLFIVVVFNENLISTTEIRKILKEKISLKSVHRKRNYSMRTDGHTW